jgi:CRP/FNR family cyclic AMP-dependent transcriptional regulator
MQITPSRRPNPTDLQLLGRLTGLSWLSVAQMTSLDRAISSSDVERREMIFEEKGKLSPDTHILLSGVAQLSRIDDQRGRVIAILSPGVMFRVPLMPSQAGHHFRWTALAACGVASLTTERFAEITLGISVANFARVADGGDGRMASLLLRYPSFLGFSLLQRVASALLELALEFGVPNTRGLLLRITITQSQLADLVGASRPKVGLVLIDLERRKLVVREGRHLAVVVQGLETLLKSAT